jgi:hypothetical protein
MALGGIGGDLAFGMPHETRYARDKLIEINSEATKNIDDRIGIGKFAAGISRDQRDWANLKTRPIERALSDVLRNRLNGDQTSLVSGAQKSVFDAYDKSGSEAKRNAARYGVNVDPSADAGFGLDRTKTAIQVGNLAAQTDRDSALQDAQRFYQGGSGLPGVATQQYIAGAGSLADQQDYSTGRKIGDAMSQIDAQEAVGMSFADGGEVGGVGGRVIDGESERVELNSGDFIIPEHAVEFYGQEFWDKLVSENGGEPAGSENGYADGGSVFDTVRMKNKHTEEYGAGNTDKQFGPWLEENGYELTADNQVRVKSDKTAGYADGGSVGFGLGQGIERGYGESIGTTLGAVRKGMIAGLGESRRQQEHDEDRGYIREDRAYQTGQRQKADIKAAYERDIDEATARFVQSDGVDLAPLVGVQKKYSKTPGGDLVTAQNPDGTFSLTAVGADGKPVSEPKKVSADDLRSIGMNMIEAMRDPKALIKSWNEKPTTVSTAEGATTSAYNPRTRKWERIADNPKDPRKEASGKYNPLSNANAISKLIGERLGGKYDDITGKMIKPPDDPELATALTASAHEYERTHPGERLPGEVVKMVFDQTQGAVREDEAKKIARQEIDSKTGYLSTDETDLGMPRRDYEKKRVREITSGGGFGIGGASSSPPAKPAGQQGRSPDQVKSDFKSGKLTREQARQELKAMGFK